MIPYGESMRGGAECFRCSGLDYDRTSSVRQRICFVYFLEDGVYQACLERWELFLE